MTLYEVLGLTPSATPDEIKRAYRKLAKQHHPDCAGAAETARFNQIKHAYDILRDPIKRQRYDATGDENNAPDNTAAKEAEARALLMGVITNAFAQILKGMIEQNQSAAVKTHDFNLIAIEFIRGQNKEIADVRVHNVKLREMSIEAAARYSARTGENTISPMIESQLAMIDQQIKNLDAQAALNIKAIEELQRFEYRFEKPPPRKMHIVYSTRWIGDIE